MTTSTDKFASIGFQLTAARRRLGNRPRLYSAIADFNSQPREGGWMHHQTQTPQLAHFNSQPREGGWLSVRGAKALAKISTHSRAKAAGSKKQNALKRSKNFNSQPREGGWLIASLLMVIVL